MHPLWIRWLPLDTNQIAPPATKTHHDSVPLRLAQMVEIRKMNNNVWREALVVDGRSNEVLVRYAGQHQRYDEWISFTPEFISPSGQHFRKRTLSNQRQLSVVPCIERSRVIQAQNPRFQQYQDTLASRGFVIHSVEGDGNCLFRSVSHQVYGDDRYHALVRAYCMDYMESEKEYFEPYVVGDMSDYLRYLEHKRRDGVWGDDPEIQAICELYDRPAEVFAYDPIQGVRKLRTFHENSALARNRPPICLSYYGGGHYDSLVSPTHNQHLLTEVPGEWEKRYIASSRRMNTREGGSTAQRVETSNTSSASTETVELEHILMVSRQEFDAMRSNLEDSLQRTLAESETTALHSEQRQLVAATQESELAAIQAELIEKARETSEQELLQQAINASLQENILPVESPNVDFDAQVLAAIQESLIEARQTTTVPNEEEEMNRILALSAQEYDTLDANRCLNDEEDMDELQRAIQASLKES